MRRYAACRAVLTPATSFEQPRSAASASQAVRSRSNRAGASPTGTHGAELHIGHPASGFAPFADVTRGKACLGKENRLAERLVADGEDLPLKIQAGKICSVSSAHALSEAGFASTARPLPAFLPGLHRLRHHRRQSLRPEAELLVQRHVLRLCGKVKSPAWRMRQSFEQRHRRLEQALADPAFPTIWPHGDRARTPKLPQRAQSKLGAQQSSPRKGRRSRREGVARATGFTEDPESCCGSPSTAAGRRPRCAEAMTDSRSAGGEIAFHQRANGDLHSADRVPSRFRPHRFACPSRCARSAAGSAYIAISSRTGGPRSAVPRARIAASPGDGARRSSELRRLRICVGGPDVGR